MYVARTRDEGNAVDGRFSATWKERHLSPGGSGSTKGYLCVVIAALMWASSGTAGKALFDAGMSPFDLVQIRVTLASGLVFVLFLVFSRDLLRLRPKDIPFFLLLGSVVMAVVTGSYLYTISKIQVAAAILIQYLAPILVAIFAILFWKERPTFVKITALFLAFGGCFLVVGGYNLDLLRMNLLGILGGLTSAVAFAGYSLLGERAMHRYRPWTVLFYALAFSALTWHVVYPPFTYIDAGYSVAQWGWILYISIVGTVLPFGLFFTGINHVRSTRASITATLEPIFAGVLAFILLGETLLLLQVVGGCMVILAIVLLQLQQEHDELAPALIRTQKD
jgi:drug/metabolite transporter (DMT)-like permease